MDTSSKSERGACANDGLLELSRSLQTLQTHHQETVSSHSSADHASQILALDTQKFRIAKTASDLEIEGERLEQELEALNGRLQELEMQGVEGSEGERGKRELEDETLYVNITHPPLSTTKADKSAHRLKLKVYRSLGIDIEADNAGNYNKAIIRNVLKGDVHVVNIDPKFSRFFYANYFWQTM